MSVNATTTVSMSPSPTSTRSCSSVSIPRRRVCGVAPRCFSMGLQLREPACLRATRSALIQSARLGAPHPVLDDGEDAAASAGQFPLDRGQFLRLPWTLGPVNQFRAETSQ